MDLTKREKEEIIQVYDTWLTSYLTGDVKTYDSYFDDRYHFIGSTDNEDFLNRKDTTKFFEETAEQLAGKVQIKNNRRTIEKFGEIIFVTELFDAFFLISEEWKYYGKFRFTSALKKKKEGWRFIYQHFSTPDSKAQDGETIGTEQIAAENLMLREAVQRRTAELEQKNHELEIETALERVRTVAMGMQKPNDILEVCKIISDQLEKLNLSNIRNTQVAIIKEKTYLNYQYFAAYAKKVFEETEFENNAASQTLVEKMQKSTNSYFVGSIKGKELQEFREWRKKYNQFPDPILDHSSEAHHYFYSIGEGGLGLTTYKKISRSSVQIFKRFHKVFKLAYQRFIDIEKAEAQAREAQIEASLERIRSKALSMQNSNEVGDVNDVLFDEFEKMGIEMVGCGISVIDEKTDQCEQWRARQVGIVDSFEPFSYKRSNQILKKKLPEMHAQFTRVWKQGDPFYRMDLKGTQRDLYLKSVAELFNYNKSKKKKLSNSLPESFITYYIY